MVGADRAGLRLTARGAIALLFVITLLGQAMLPSGVGFVAGCLAAALLVRPRDLLPLVVTPPLVFFVAALLVEGVHSLASGSVPQTLGVGLFTALSSGAPWLFAGTALTLLIAWRRGLPANVRELRGGGPEPARAATPDAPDAPGAARGRGTGRARSRTRRGRTPVFDPEPEGYFEPRLYGRAADE
ncbi:DUF6542 domain-containing protein [Sphaerimonospora thailandensis]|uniref:DUF6542 domain-containing protein n=1 Tax=Sphaerimonospora thailandensis TaxID=795644 RepID=A0A8J3R516_9ACTN|nr:DUF6542 domain-containing protein [Sphaerimonospora thailandensis]GIH69217.1 hypothetical protein Mth01_14700 [Sphaerimonospora thailandensis]